MQLPTILLITDKSKIAIKLIDLFKENNFYIFVVSDKSNWVSKSQTVRTLKTSDLKNFKPDYILSLNFTNTKYLAESLKIIKQFKPKSLIVFSVDTINKKIFKKTTGLVNSKIIITGLPVNFAEEKTNSIEALIKKAIKSRKIKINPNDKFYLIEQEKTAKIISQELFTYSQAKPILVAKIVSASEFAQELSLYISGLKIITTKKTKTHKFFPEPLSTLDIDLSAKSYIEKALDKTKKEKIKSKRFNIKTPKTNIPLILFSFFILLLAPYVLILFSTLSLFASYKFYLKNEIKLSSYALVLSDKQTTIQKPIIKTYLKVPLIKNLYTPLINAQYVLELANSSFVNGKEALSGVASLGDLALNGNSGANIETISQELYYKFDLLYKDLSFLEAATKNTALFGFAKKASIDISKIRIYVSASKDLIWQLPEMLGFEEEKTYMVLLQNNMELRPTGGFIGSFALITFSKGKLVDTEVFDVYAVDGQLKGYVKPPDPIKNYLGEASWYLRDSNWDPDFPKTAKRIEWFLDKSIDRKVNGVVGINLDLISKLLEKTGPIKAADYEDIITADNLYTKIQHEVESDFFPGSRKKANYLTAISLSLIDKLKTVSPSEYKDIALILSESLESNDIQLYFENSEVEKIVSRFGWDGSLKEVRCSGNCINTWFTLNEANVGVNKANKHIKRKADFTVSLDKERVNYKLTILIKNLSQDLSREPETRYKAYLRLITKKGSEFEKVQIVKNAKIQEKDLEIETVDNKRIDGGVLIDIPPSSENQITFSWSEKITADTNKPGFISVNWIRQPGVNPYPVRLMINARGLNIHPDSNDFLTEGGYIGYNITLAKDINRKFFWK